MKSKSLNQNFEVYFQASLLNIPYDPILQDLAISPRNMSAAEIVEYWLELIETKDVTEWYYVLKMIDIPSLQKTFSGLFTHIMLLDFGYNATVDIARPFMGSLL